MNLDNFKHKLYQIKNSIYHLRANVHSYSQNGEDIIIKRTLAKLGIRKINYIDIGCNHPIDLNNTYLAYKHGGKGILVDANPKLSRIIQRKRKQDKFVNLGVSDTNSDDLTFYSLSNSALSTFDKELAQDIVKTEQATLVDQKKIPIIGINSLLQEYFTKDTHLVSIDIEGFDTKILKAWNFKKYRPLIFCVETISNLASGKRQTKVDAIFKIFESENYIAFADTYINTIFVDKQKWNNR